MSNTVMVPKNEFDDLVNTVKRIEHLLASLLKKQRGTKAEEEEPEYGTSAWWKWADKKGMEAIKKGEYTRLETPKELQKHLDSLK